MKKYLARRLRRIANRLDPVGPSITVWTNGTSISGTASNFYVNR